VFRIDGRKSMLELGTGNDRDLDRSAVAKYFYLRAQGLMLDVSQPIP